MASISSSRPRTVDQIYKDFTKRRSALVRALTCYVEAFYSLCDHPDLLALALSEQMDVTLSLTGLRLFDRVNEMPTLFEPVTERKPNKEKPSMDAESKSRNGTERSFEGLGRSIPKSYDKNHAERVDEHDETLCGSCGVKYSADEFWIRCDICERCFHGKCVRITPAKAESIEQCKCPSCNSKQSRR